MRVHHLAFRTRDLAQLERFYVHALGLAVVRRNEERSVWLDAGGSLVMLELAEPGEASPAAGRDGPRGVRGRPRDACTLHR